MHRRRSKGMVAAVVATSVVLVSLGAVTPATAASQKTLPEQLTAKVTTDGVYRHLRAFQRIADTNGGNRAAGTSGYQKSVDYVVNALTRAGFNVSTPEFSYSSTTVKTAQATFDGTVYPVGVLTGSGNSAPGGTQAKLSIAAANGCAAQDYPASVQNSIVLIQRGACNFSQKRDLATAAGAVGAVIYNNVPGSFSGTLGSAQVSGIPVAAISQAEGEAASAKPGSQVSLDIQIEEKQVVTQNVIAETRTGRVDNVVMAGAHLDGVPAGPGMNDNGSGSAALLETALQLGGSPKTENAVRFAWWGAEELGLLGSFDYVGNLTFEQQLDIALYMNFDMIGSPNAGYFVNGDNPDPNAQEPLGSKSIAKVFADYMQSAKGVVPEKGPLGGGTDHVPFARAGIASAGLFTGVNNLMSEEQAKKWGGQANQPYDPNYHQRGDNLNNINRTAIGVNSSTMAWGVGTFAMDTAEVNGIPPREQRANAQRSLMRSPGGAEAFPVNDPSRGRTPVS
ncbi:M28 family peptidase [Arthrobacter russicus]|uniref:Zn-dependent M28 family amino/carboxypeptidase n=1 Tax=Arthrobacter russicus TaxID=172040 RepID=A0ABU1JE19_9MICC|nr:M28 family peptidase [Arthrobacter russicus]MDR6270121.1 Zn-dependent M28 family amino/carboxypeptidase [Arthrobacter russicus]